MRTPRKKADRKRLATPNQKLLSLRQVCEEFGFPPRTLLELVTTGKIPYIKLPEGRKVWLRRTDVEQLIASSVTLAVTQ